MRPQGSWISPISPSSELEIRKWGEETKVCNAEDEGEVGDQDELLCGFCDAERVGQDSSLGGLKKLLDPKLPSRKEVDDHYLTH